ncbi:hypothetical protein PAXRUDRAFT_401959 [Paxillus rubicundulus Ve08.2h10]|uniref:Uncharacterized protein n=1 Tax=Paxillus rubicundulus Ve08.2h10 TaxID=930991 RepID=A0A0D0E8R5_9AGAM|nr:hypothetical protein PAXRUDRAFT_401959 [Paxillus rubicundulus Ve08.2h10]
MSTYISQTNDTRSQNVPWPRSTDINHTVHVATVALPHLEERVRELEELRRKDDICPRIRMNQGRTLRPQFTARWGAFLSSARHLGKLRHTSPVLAEGSSGSLCCIQGVASTCRQCLPCNSHPRLHREGCTYYKKHFRRGMISLHYTNSDRV